ncbi:hypothetical protein MMC09_005164 [Bachmanniomyces sp. S44760]|nr:hypothetical protein [Bachmanniomyces sp. S44760]
MPYPNPTPSSRRPKLCLQTSTLPPPFARKSATALNIGLPGDSPTIRNTYANAFEPAISAGVSSPTTSNAQIQQAASTTPTCRTPLSSTEQASTPSSNVSSTTTSTSSDIYPSPSSHSHNHIPPYTLPHTARSILRNSPLPRRHLTLSATTSRPPRRMFPPVKRVLFRESLAEVAPTPVVEASESESESSDSSEGKSKRRRGEKPSLSMTTNGNAVDETDAVEDAPSTPIQGRRKKRREWVWTLDPVAGGDDGATEQDPSTMTDMTARQANLNEERLAEGRVLREALKGTREESSQ